MANGGAKATEPKKKNGGKKEVDLTAYLKPAGERRPCKKNLRIYTQGDPCHDVYYIQSGAVKLTVLSRSGKEAVVAMLGPGDFFGEGALAGHPIRLGSATSVTACVILTVDKNIMAKRLHDEPGFSDRFIAYMVERTIRIEADLVDQLFNSSEKRLARTLLLLSRYSGDKGEQSLPKIPQETLAEMIGATRSRVNYFMNKFRKLGLIEYNGGLKINRGMLSVVLHD